MGRIVARLVAPLAIVAVAAVAYVIVHDNVRTTSSSGTAHHHHADTRGHHARHHGHKTSPKPVFYTVKSGDTLSEIVAHTGVSLSQITSLNPSLVPPYSLTTGQRLRLRR